jgi:hypothetical protein
VPHLGIRAFASDCADEAAKHSTDISHGFSVVLFRKGR